MSLHSVNRSRYPGTSIRNSNNLDRHDHLGGDLLHRKAKNIDQASKRYVHRQNQRRPDRNRPVIQVVSCQYDPEGTLDLTTAQSVYNLTDLTAFGVVKHAPLSSIQALDHALHSGADVVVVKGHGGFLKEEGTGRLKHQIALREDQRFNLSGGCLWILLNAILNWLFSATRVTCSADSLSTHAHPNLKSIILDTCSGGKVIILEGEEQRPTGMALDLAHRYRGVAVTGANQNIGRDIPRNYVRLGEGGLGVSIQLETGKEVSRTFCVDPRKNYKSVDDLKQAADRLESGSDDLKADAEFKHLLDHTKLTFKELQEVYGYCEDEAYTTCLALFQEAIWYPSFDELHGAPPCSDRAS